jgi:hypothetical protein
MAAPAELDEVMLLLFPEGSLAFSSYSADERKKFRAAFAQCKNAVASILDEVSISKQNPNSDKKITAAVAVAEKYISSDAKQKLSASRRRLIIYSLVMACMAFAQARSVNREAFDRVKAKLGTHKARSKRASKSVRKDVREGAARVWEKKPELQNKPSSATARAIQRDNPKLRDHEFDTIRKHVGEFKRELKQRA